MAGTLPALHAVGAFMDTVLLIVTAVASVGALALLLARRGGPGMGGASDAAPPATADDLAAAFKIHAEQVAALEGRLRDELRRSEKAAQEAAAALREEQARGAGTLREEQARAAGTLRDEQRKAAADQRTHLTALLNDQIKLTLDQLKHVRDTLDLQLAQVRETLGAQLTQVRQSTAEQLVQLSADNQRKLDEMRAVVDEKLQATLQTRLGEAFKQVSERLEQVHKGLGEMQTLAGEVGGLKRVMAGVKTRGILGEVQLETILDQFLTPDQMGRNVETAPGSGKRVEFAVRMPGQDKDHPVWLPIDAKFPKEDYERLLEAHDNADRPAAEIAAAALATRLVGCARDIRDKYVDPPHTTDFALLFLPTEGLYAEALRRPGLADQLQHDHRVIIAGPTTLAAILQSLQMGFRTLALEKRSSEVWSLLGAVKTEFRNFGDWLERARKQLQTASNTLDLAGTRTRAVERKLRDVQELPREDAALLLPPTAAADDPDEE